MEIKLEIKYFYYILSQQSRLVSDCSKINWLIDFFGYHILLDCLPCSIHIFCFFNALNGGGVGVATPPSDVVGYSSSQIPLSVNCYNILEKERSGFEFRVVLNWLPTKDSWLSQKSEFKTMLKFELCMLIQLSAPITIMLQS